MNAFIALHLAQDALAEGALCCLLAMALVFVFALTRIVFIPQGEFVSFSALTYIGLVEGKGAPAAGFVLIVSLLAGAADAAREVQDGRKAAARAALRVAAPGVGASALALAAGHAGLPMALNALVAVLLVTALGPALYVLVYKSIARASMLVLLIASVALHLMLQEIGLLIFGPDGGRVAPLLKISLRVANVPIQAQYLVIYAVTAALVAGLFVISERSLHGKALRAAAMNPTGARLMGVSLDRAGRAAFAMAAFAGAVTGVLVASVTTIYFDSGFLLALKGFVAAVVGGLSSYPLAALGALGIGVVESLSSFFASAYKESIVFAAIIPVLLILSLRAGHAGEEE